MTLPEPSEFARAKAAQLLALMLDLKGSHYVWGATGDVAIDALSHSPDDFDGMPREDEHHVLMGRVVQMLPNRPDLDEEPSRRHHFPPLPDEINLFAAYSDIRFVTVCCGRCAVATGDLALPERSRSRIDLERLRELARTPGQYRWPRSYRRGEEGPHAPVYHGDGEPCEGKRHFDCVGFVRYCLWRITGARHQRSILQWIKASQREMTTIQVSDGPPLSQAEILPGDLIITPPHNHIALATGWGMVMEAQSEEYGVCHNCLSLHGKIVRRFTDRFWAGQA